MRANMHGKMQEKESFYHLSPDRPRIQTDPKCMEIHLFQCVVDS